MKKLLPIMFLLLSLNAFSQNISYENWIEQEISAFHDDNEYEEVNLMKKAPVHWDLDKIRLRVRPLIGVEVPFLASFEIKPFIEFHWQPPNLNDFSHLIHSQKPIR